MAGSMTAELREWLLALEESFWYGDGAFYQQHLAADALMVFGDPVGVLDRETTVRSIADSPRWQQVQLEDVRLAALGADAVVLTYRATARRNEDEPEYRARASSAYVHRGGEWLLAFHQQTPAT